MPTFLLLLCQIYGPRLLLSKNCHCMLPNPNLVRIVSLTWCKCNGKNAAWSKRQGPAHSRTIQLRSTLLMETERAFWIFFSVHITKFCTPDFKLISRFYQSIFFICLLLQSTDWIIATRSMRETTGDSSTSSSDLAFIAAFSCFSLWAVGCGGSGKP